MHPIGKGRDLSCAPIYHSSYFPAEDSELGLLALYVLFAKTILVLIGWLGMVRIHQPATLPLSLMVGKYG